MSVALYILVSINVILLVVFIALYRRWVLLRHIATLEDILDAPGHGLVFFDRRQRFFWASDQAKKYLPFLKNQKKSFFAQPKRFNDFLNYMFDHGVECDESLKNALEKSGKNRTLEVFREVFQWQEGKYCLAELQKTKNGRYVLVLIDISSAKKHEEDMIELNDSNHKLSEAVAVIDNGVMIVDVCDRDYPITFVNNALAEYFSLKRDVIIGLDVSEVLRVIENEDAYAEIMEALKNKKGADIELLLEKAGKRHWFNLKLSSMREGNKDTTHMIGVFTETTALKMKEVEFFQAQKLEALGKLAAGVAHDFNNVLSIIDGYARMIDKDLVEGDIFKPHVDRIRTASQRGADLTKQMLTFSRHKIVNNEVINFAEVVSSQEILIKPLVDASIDFHLSVENPEIYVECSEDNIAQILLNLCVNARDAMSDGGEIHVRVFECSKDGLPKTVLEKAEHGCYACMSVTDTGSGIDDKTLEHIFDPFFTTKDQGEGTGLGLSMVYGIVQQLSGHIHVDTEVGRGTCISLYLPISDNAPKREVQGNLDDISSINMTGYSVLIAEDEEDLLVIVKDMLERLGMTVLAASSGNEALCIQDEFEGKLDFLLTDVVMPDLNGLHLSELLSELRPETRTIFMSGYPANGRMAKVDLPDDAFFMAKPLQYEALARLMYQLVTNEDVALQINAPSWETVE